MSRTAPLRQLLKLLIQGGLRLKVMQGEIVVTSERKLAVEAARFYAASTDPDYYLLDAHRRTVVDVAKKVSPSVRRCI